jgi:transketolase
MADILAVLYGKILSYKTEQPKWAKRDRFILSKGHGCVGQYAVLAECGFFPLEKLLEYGEDNSVLMHHVSHHVTGVEFSSGALGHGLPFGLGKALAAKITGEKWQTHVLLSDGEMDEGSNWEAIMFAGHHQISNLTATIDYNKIQSLDHVKNVLDLEPLADKLHSFGWEVLEIDGHNHQELLTAYQTPHTTKPRMILAHTVKGRGVSFMENKVLWHYRNPSPEQLAAAIAEIEAYHA